MATNTRGLALKLSVLVFGTFIGIVLLEVGAGFVWKNKYNQWLERHLHGFDHVDYERSIVVPNPNTRKTIAQYRTDLREFEKPLGLRNFEQSIQANAPPDSIVLFSINAHGFKGPEIMVPKPDSTFRILTIGNSCTWGPANDYYAYPRVMERELNRLLDQRIRVEVVNGGVLGDNFERVLKRIDGYLDIEPDLITIYLGWNQSISRADPKKNMYLYRHFALYRIFYHFVMNRTDTGLEVDYQTKTVFDRDDPGLEAFRRYSFGQDMTDLDRLLRMVNRRDGRIKIILITLAGLLDVRTEPDSSSLDRAYPIASTNNLYAYPLLTGRYNDELREYASEHQLDVIDFEAYAFRNMAPRSVFWRDSVHLTDEGYLVMGKYFADEIREFLPFSAH